LRNVCAADWRDAGCDPGQHAVDCLSFAAFFFAPRVG